MKRPAEHVAPALKASAAPLKARKKLTGQASTPGQRRAAAKARASVSAAGRKRQFEAWQRKGVQVRVAKVRGKPATPELRAKGLKGSAAAKKYHRARRRLTQQIQQARLLAKLTHRRRSVAMNTMLSPQREDIVAEIARINEIEDREELLARFHDYWRNAKINIHFMVQLIKRFEGLGFEFTQQDETECRMLPLLRQIAADQIDMELAQRCLSKDDATANRLFEVAKRLPMPDHRRIGSDQPMRIMELSGDHRLLQPSTMNRREIDQLIDRKLGKLRNEAEQLAWLREENLRRAWAAEAVPVYEPVRMLKGGIDIVLGGEKLHLTLSRLEKIVDALKAR